MTQLRGPHARAPMSHRIMLILKTYKRLYKDTGKPEPRIKSARYLPPPIYLSFACAPQTQLHLRARGDRRAARWRCTTATISAQVLADLCKLPATPSTFARIPGIAKLDMTKPYAGAPPTPARLAAVSKSDPLTANWDGTLAVDERGLPRGCACTTRWSCSRGGGLSGKAIIEKAIAELKK
ncbi:hypothetical protein DFH09DRAFT_1470543 [Mycena vulgaris]|nr:hypothetical protein DFH09DRAFT_1470543 [Mycena vulgaris]